MINLKIIAKRKRVYGSNFKAIAKKWTQYCGVELTEIDIAEMMAEMKRARIEHIEERIGVLKASLEDSEMDFANYKWIAENFEEYQKL